MSVVDLRHWFFRRHRNDGAGRDAKLQDEAREDFRFLRRLRLAMDGATSKVGGAVLLAIVSGVLWLLWIGFQAIFPNI
ncbi:MULTISPECIES: hypothetical protein [Chelativorans]|uniref:hypothetical protein n=1 Tax=Chelativorans TaxID=449972 RepID=UPI0002D9EB4B|nr:MULTISPECIES: hypothetical protein [Chelativorans]